MGRIFAYCRVSTADQDTSNQLHEIERAGFIVEPKRVVCEVVSGSVPAAERKGLSSLLHKLEDGDSLIVTKLDRLGRNAIDVRQTVDGLAAMGVNVVCLALGGASLTSAAGRMVMGVLNAMAEFERDLIVERTQAGLARAKAEGVVLGRPRTTEVDAILQELARQQGNVSATARVLGCSRATVIRARDRAS